jgi:rhodanese-related sulfurtransferase
VKAALREDFLRTAIFFLVSVALGWGIDRWRPQPLPWIYVPPAERLERQVEKIGTFPATEAAPNPIDLEAFRRWIAEKRGPVLDARAEVFYQMGHVPGALNLPRETFDQGYERIRGRLGKGIPLVVYCSDPGCEDSHLVAKALMRLGYSQVWVYGGGWQEWTEQGLPAEAGP